MTSSVDAESSPEAIPTLLTLPRNRDASAAIAGYVYQVQLTILRWLDLPATDLLELEAGEDIDQVGSAIVDGRPEDLRTLEQVKLSTAPLTLRSATALEALANAAELLESNPELRLQFRFTTTARVSTERPSPYPGRNKKPAIELWNSLRSSRVSPHAEATITSLAAAWKRPSKVAAKTWSALERCVGPTGDGALTLAALFEWSTGAQGPADLRTKILQRLGQDHGLTTERDQVDAYHRIFHKVFAVLATPGRKQLNRDLLLGQLADPSTPSHENKSFQRIVRLLESQERALESLSHDILTLGAQQVQLLGPGSQIASAAEYLNADLRLSTAPPPLSPLSVNRSGTASTVLSRSGAAIWVGLFGTSGSGKTQLDAVRLRDKLGTEY